MKRSSASVMCSQSVEMTAAKKDEFARGKYIFILSCYIYYKIKQRSVLVCNMGIWECNAGGEL